jgi:hypothetical protein
MRKSPSPSDGEPLGRRLSAFFLDDVRFPPPPNFYGIILTLGMLFSYPAIGRGL